MPPSIVAAPTSACDLVGDRAAVGRVVPVDEPEVVRALGEHRVRRRGTPFLAHLGLGRPAATRRTARSRRPPRARRCRQRRGDGAPGRPLRRRRTTRARPGRGRRCARRSRSGRRRRPRASRRGSTTWRSPGCDDQARGHGLGRGDAGVGPRRADRRLDPVGEAVPRGLERAHVGQPAPRGDLAERMVGHERLLLAADHREVGLAPRLDEHERLQHHGSRGARRRRTRGAGTGGRAGRRAPRRRPARAARDRARGRGAPRRGRASPSSPSRHPVTGRQHAAAYGAQRTRTRAK